MSEWRGPRRCDGGPFVEREPRRVRLHGLSIPALAAALAASPSPVVAAGTDLHLIPRPAHVEEVAGCSVSVGPLLRYLRLPPSEPFSVLDAAASEIVRERWSALGVSASQRPADRNFSLSGAIGMQREPGTDAGQSYDIRLDHRGLNIGAKAPDGVFYAWMTIAQLVRRGPSGWELPCVTIHDAPALRWRILSDDVSRGPLPTMRYFEERIRTIASFKMNGYSPYMEHVFAAPKHPLPAPLDGITPAQLHALALYAERYHVALIPEQQTFAHMHETLRWEKYAPLAELPHGYLLSPANPGGEAYVRDLISDELAAVPHPPFFHIGSDEPSDLGRGQSQALVSARGEGAVFGKHVVDTANFVIAHSGARPLIWDDALARHPELFAELPKQLVFVNWHYGSEKTYLPYIKRIADGGFEQMVAPGALNWNEIYPDLDAARTNIDRFITEGKAAHVLGLFQTVWHDDGETLFEATWYPVIYAAASAWESDSIPRERFDADFPSAFFGTDDAGYASDLARLGAIRTLLAGNPREYGDYLFWADAFDPDVRDWTPDTRAIRLAAEATIEHLMTAPAPPLHANAAAVMQLAARRYDLLGRNLQIASESRGYYDDARAHAGGGHDDLVYRGLFVTKYLFWEERDAMLALVPLVRAAWEYEDRASHESSVLERYHLAAQLAIERADRFSRAASFYREGKALPAFDEVLGSAP